MLCCAKEKIVWYESVMSFAFAFLPSLKILLSKEIWRYWLSRNLIIHLISIRSILTLGLMLTSSNDTFETDVQMEDWCVFNSSFSRD